MKTAATACRWFLGLLFVLVGSSGVYYLFVPPGAAPEGLARDFQHVYFASHWVLFVDAVEFASGALLLANRFVPLALVLTGAVIPNILVYHATMQPNGLPFILLMIAAWTVLFARYRPALAPIFRA
jgi:hypothetical protein